MFISKITQTPQNTFQEVEHISLTKVLKITALATLTMWSIDPLAISFRMRECLLLTFAISAMDQLIGSKRAKECRSHSRSITNISDAHHMEVADVTLSKNNSIFSRIFGSSLEEHSDFLGLDAKVYLRAFIPQTRKNMTQGTITKQTFQLSSRQASKEKTGVSAKVITLAAILIAINNLYIPLFFARPIVGRISYYPLFR